MVAVIVPERPVHVLAEGERDPVPPLPNGELTIEAVPPASRPSPTPLMRILMPVIMVAALGAVIALMVLSRGALNPMMLIFPLMMVMGFLMMFAPPQGEDVDETRRTYLRHLQALREKALANAQAQRAHYVHCHPHPEYLWQLVASRRLWERATGDKDVLDIRIGLGTTPLCTPVVVAESGATEDLDPVCAVSVRHTVRAVAQVPNMPVVVALPAFPYISFQGPDAADALRALIANIVFHHGPDTVGISALVDTPTQGASRRSADHAGDWEWLKWLPHTQNPKEAAHHIVVIDDRTYGTSGREQVVAQMLADPTISCVISVGAREGSFLAQQAEEEGLSLYCDHTLRVHTANGMEELGIADRLSIAQATLLARRMHGCIRPQQRSLDATGNATHTGDLLAMLGLRDPEQLVAETMWPPLNPQERLKVPVGLSDAGHILQIDLKEAAHGGMGPHGLCIGATGAGKSEFLRTLVVSLVATHSPDDVNLVLVDFKGGATFLGLERLPHTSAVITNLSEESVLVERMHDAISGEMNRRQELLRTSGNFANVGEYTAARAQRPELAPLPALIIIVDEFSELLGQHPDFADLFVAVGRLGRSLHVHLLLASQRLEEGRLRGLDSHLSYRIGLKTFSAAESRQVLGVPDAYHLPAKPGVGFLRADTTEAGALTAFRSAYVSGPLERRRGVFDDNEHNPAPSIIFYTSWEDLEEDTTEVEETIEIDNSTTLLDSVVDAACNAGELQGKQAHRVWLPPLPSSVELAGVADDLGHLRAAIGIIDRPYQQRQDPLVIDFSQGSGHLALSGGPRSGKSYALRTIMCSLAATHSTSQVRFYVLDLGGGELATTSRLPHVAGVANRSDPEKIRRIIDEIAGIIHDGLEAKEQGSDLSVYNGHTFLVIDGWHTISSEYEELLDTISQIAADGPGVRVHLLIATTRWTILRPAIRDLIDQRLELRLNEPLDSLIDRKAQQRIPVDAPGRGITSDSEDVLIALSSNQDIAHISTAAHNQGHTPVPAVKMLPQHITLAEASAPNASGNIFAIGGPRLEPLSWSPQDLNHMICVGSKGSGRSTWLGTMMAGISQVGRENARIVLIDPRRSHLGNTPEDMMASYAATTTAISDAIRDTATTLRTRLPHADVTPAELKARSWWSGPEIYLLIDDADVLPDGTLLPLVELLPHATDIGLHVFIARKSGGIGRAFFHAFYSGLRDQQAALLLLDCDKEEGPIMGLRPSPQPPGRGQLYVDGTAMGLCQICVPEGGEINGASI